MRARTRTLAIVAALVLITGGAMAAAAPAASNAGDELPVVLVAGASGQTGRLVLERATRAGYRVRAMARDPESARQANPQTYDWIRGDVRDPATLAAALSGVQYVICTIGATERSGPNGPEFVDYGGVRNLVEAAVTAGVRHFVLVSSTGAGGGGGAFGWLLNTVLMPGILEWKGKGEQHLRASGLTYTILRPGGLTNDPGGRAGLRFTQGDTLGGGTISRADVATLAVHSLGNTEVAGKTFEMANDEDAPPDAWKESLAGLRKD